MVLCCCFIILIWGVSGVNCFKIVVDCLDYKVWKVGLIFNVGFVSDVRFDDVDVLNIEGLVIVEEEGNRYFWVIYDKGDLWKYV